MIALWVHPESFHQQGPEQFIKDGLRKFIAVFQRVDDGYVKSSSHIPGSSLGRLQQFVLAEEVSGGHHILAEDVRWQRVRSGEQYCASSEP